MLRRLINVTDHSEIPESKGCDFNYLRADGEEYIPVRIVNGRGSVVVTSEPQKNSALEIEAASCDRVFTVMFEYVPCASVSQDGENTVFSTPYSTEHYEAVQSASKIETHVGAYTINNVKIDKSNTKGQKQILVTVNHKPTKDELLAPAGQMLHLLARS